MIKFSLLIAHYNNFEYFKECFQSIINQTYQDFEVIILDDFSTDNSFEKVKNLVKNNHRFKVFQNEKNEGVGYTKGKLIELAQGEFCGFLDPDDTLLPDALQIVLDSYQNQNHIVATYSNFYICDESLNHCRIFPNTRKIKNRNKYFFNINLEVAHFFTFKKEVYLKTEKINKEYKIAEDQDLYMKLYEKGDFYFINVPIFKYRLHKKGLSHDAEKSKQRNEYWHKVLKNTLIRRNITKLYGKNILTIENLPQFIYNKENTFFKKLLRKIYV